MVVQFYYYVGRKMSKKIYTGVDIFKILAALGVVAIHSNLILFKTLGRLGVPYFVTISSFFFFKKFIALDDTSKKRKRFIKFEKRILYLLICWDILYLPLAVRFLHNEIRDQGFSWRTIIGYLYHYFLAPANTANGWGPSWYLIAMMIGLFFFILLKRIYKTHFVLLGLTLGVIEIYYILANEFGFITHLPNSGVHGFLRVMIYIYLGYLIAVKLPYFEKHSINSYLYIFILMIVLFIIENYVIYKLGGSSNSQEVITSVPTSLSSALLAIKWQPNFSHISIRQFGTFLYCMQSYPLFVLAKYIKIDHLTGQIITFCLVIGFSLVTYWIYKWIRKETKWSFLGYAV